jgi:hypothetical protein
LQISTSNTDLLTRGSGLLRSESLCSSLGDKSRCVPGDNECLRAGESCGVCRLLRLVVSDVKRGHVDGQSGEREHRHQTKSNQHDGLAALVITPPAVSRVHRYFYPLNTGSA